MQLNTLPKNRKVAYLADVDGKNIIQFMFAPNTLGFSEGNNYYEEIKIGRTKPDVLWVSAQPQSFSFEIFIDRTAESAGTNENLDIYADYKTTGFQAASQRFFPSLTQRLRTIINKLHSSNYTIMAEYEGQLSDLNIAPHYQQNLEENEVKGVLPDLEKLLYYVRQKGAKGSDLVVEDLGNIGEVSSAISQNITADRLFVSPPKCRFYYGSIWKEGYIRNIQYQLLVPNAQLIPRRLVANIDFLITRGGTLSEVNIPETEVSDSTLA